MSSKLVATVLYCTGTQGTSVTKALSDSGKFKIRALAHNTESDKANELAKLPNVEIMDCKQYEEAMKGAEVVYAYSYDSADEFENMKKVIDSAKNAGVKLFVYSGLPSIKVETNGQISNVEIFDRKSEVEKYLQTIKDMKIIVIHLGSFAENFMKYGLLRPEGNKVTLSLQAANEDVSVPMLCVQDDLGPAVLSLIENYKNCPELFESPIRITSYNIKYGEHGDIIKKFVHKDIEILTPQTMEQNKEMREACFFEQNAEMRGMRDFFNNFGLYKGLPVPDPRLLSLGYKPHDFEYFVQNRLLPAFNL